MIIKKDIFSRKGFIRSFTYSLFDIESNISAPIQIENSIGSTQDINFSSGFINESDITTFSNGNRSVVNKFYDQKQNLYPLINETDVERPFITDASGLSLGYIDDTLQQNGLYLLPPSINKLNADGDKIFQYVMRDETENTNQRPSFRVLDNQNKGFCLSLRPSGGNYILGVNINGKLWSDTDGTGKRWIVPKETPGDFRLYTFTYIGGVHNLYVNNVLQVGDNTAELIDSGIPPLGIFLGLRSGGSGRKNNIQTFSMISGDDLSSFDISTYNSNYMTIHSIS